MFKIQGKCAPVKEQLENLEKVFRETKNSSNYFELQMVEGVSASEAVELVKEISLNVKQVHPIILDRPDCVTVCTSSLGIAKTFEMLEEACYVANEISLLNDDKTGVILHCDLPSNQSHSYAYKECRNKLKYLYDLYPNIYFCLENVTPINADCTLNNGCLPNDIKCLCDYLNDNGILTYVTLDICHARMVEVFYERVLCENDVRKSVNFREPDLSLEGWFKCLGDRIMSLHIADFYEDGNYDDNHGIYTIPHFKQMIEDLKPLLEKYLDDKVALTIEVKDEDYANKINQKSAMEDCLDVLN